jgi:hypothetical protein
LFVKGRRLQTEISGFFLQYLMNGDTGKVEGPRESMTIASLKDRHGWFHDALFVLSS